MPEPSPHQAGTATTRALLACGVLAAVVFTTVWAVAGATRAHYDPMRHAISTLQLGEHGWTQTTSFVLTGLLMLAYTVGLRRAIAPLGGSTWGPLMVGAYAVGLIGAGIFRSDPVSGYPPGTPDLLVEYSTAGALHDLFSALVFLGLPVACFVFARRLATWGRPGWAVYSVVTGVLFLTGTVLASIAFGQVEPLVDLGGLLQRATLTIGWAWLVLIAIHLLANRSPLRRVEGVGSA